MRELSVLELNKVSGASGGGTLGGLYSFTFNLTSSPFFNIPVFNFPVADQDAQLDDEVILGDDGDPFIVIPAFPSLDLIEGFDFNPDENLAGQAFEGATEPFDSNIPNASLFNQVLLTLSGLEAADQALDNFRADRTTSFMNNDGAFIEEIETLAENNILDRLMLLTPDAPLADFNIQVEYDEGTNQFFIFVPDQFV